MKNTFIISMALIAFASCKKDRVCTCKVTDKTAGGSSSYDVTYTMHKVTRNTAKTNCVDYDANNVNTGETVSYNCTLKP
jgi:hypothetical protein